MPSRFERVPQPEQPSSLDLSRFSEYYPRGHIEKIVWDDLPKANENYLTGTKDLRPKDQVQECYRVTHKKGDESYITIEKKNNFEELYFIDRKDEKYVGWGKMRKFDDQITDGYGDEPHDAWTTTDEKYRGQGLGTRRYLLMNAAAQAKYGEPLRSDVLFEDEQDEPYGPEHIWKGFVKRGLAFRDTVYFQSEPTKIYRMRRDAKPE